MAQRMVALLRGINVGKAKRIAMADLRELLAGLGYTEIRTHLNSGNVVFSCPPRSAASAAAKIQKAILSDLGVDCAVQTRTAAELTDLVANNPLAEVATDGSRYLVAFLSAVPPAKAISAIEKADYGPDRIVLAGSNAYLWCSGGVLDSPLSKLAWSADLGVSATTRNWNTVCKLAELATEPAHQRR